MTATIDPNNLHYTTPPAPRAPDGMHLSRVRQSVEAMILYRGRATFVSPDMDREIEANLAALEAGRKAYVSDMVIQYKDDHILYKEDNEFARVKAWQSRWDAEVRDQLDAAVLQYDAEGNVLPTEGK